jgi:hypothetical protein
VKRASLSSTMPLKDSYVTTRRPDGISDTHDPDGDGQHDDETNQDFEGEGLSDRQKILHERTDALWIELFQLGGRPKGGHQDQRRACTVA